MTDFQNLEFRVSHATAVAIILVTIAVRISAILLTMTLFVESFFHVFFILMSSISPRETIS